MHKWCQTECVGCAATFGEPLQLLFLQLATILVQGFSGQVRMASRSTDLQGHMQTCHVLR